MANFNVPGFGEFLDLNERVENVEARDALAGQHAYSAPSDESLAWDTTGLIRLDVAITAMHLMTARIAFRSFPHLIKAVVNSTIRRLSEWVVKHLAEAVISSIAFKMVQNIVFLAEVWKQVQQERDAEDAIRRASLAIRRQLLTFRLEPKPRTHRKTEWVDSRHETALPKRKPNTEWLKSNPR